MPLTLDYIALGIVAGLKITAGKFTSAFNLVQSYINILEASVTADIANLAALKAGTDAFTRLSMGAPGTTLEIDPSGAIAVTKSRHRIDTNGGAASDDLVTVTGSINGGMLILQSVSAARPITVKHNTGSFYNASQQDLVLSTPELMWVGFYDSVTGKIVGGILGTGGGAKLKELLDTTTVVANELSVPDRALVTTGYGAPFLDVQPSFHRRAFMFMRSTGASSFLASLCTTTQIGNWGSGGGTSDTYYTQVSTGTTINNVGGVRLGERVQTSFNPVIRFHINNNGINQANSTVLLGLVGRVVTSTTPVNTTETVAALRIRNTGGAGAGTLSLDIIAGNNTSQTTTSLGTISSVDTALDVSLRFDGTLNKVFVSINDGAETEHSTTMPPTGLGMYPHAIITNLTTTNVWFQVARMDVSFN